MAVTPPLPLRLADSDSERVRQSHARAIVELQARPEIRVIKDLSLEDNVRTTVAHGLGRTPQWIGLSPARGAASVGCFVEFRNGVDRTQRVDIAASGFGATILADLMVVG